MKKRACDGKLIHMLAVSKIDVQDGANVTTRRTGGTSYCSWHGDYLSLQLSLPYHNPLHFHLANLHLLGIMSFDFNGIAPKPEVGENKVAIRISRPFHE